MISATALGGRLWLLTSTVFAVALFCFSIIFNNGDYALVFFSVGFIASLLGSVPALISFFITLPFIKNSKISWQAKFIWLLVQVLIIDVCYSILPAAAKFNDFYLGKPNADFLSLMLIYTAVLFLCTFIAMLLSLKKIALFFAGDYFAHSSYITILQQLFFLKNNHKTIIMDYVSSTPKQPQQPAASNANKILIKGLITGGLILLMLIPTLFIDSLIQEREARQKEVVKEVSSKWAAAQNLSAPFIVVPYTENVMNSEGKLVPTKTQLIVLADKLLVNGKLFPEQRPRSIYKVLLYRAEVNFSGSFKPSWPVDIDTANIDFANAKLCFSLSDFKGIEEEVTVVLITKN